MDVVLGYLDRVALDSVWAKVDPSWGREHIIRQCVSLYAITMAGVLVLYFGIAGASYKFMFDKRMMRHPRFLKGQIRKEITMSVKGFPWLDLMTLPWFLGECRGYSLMYEGVENSPFGHGKLGGYAYILLSAGFFLWFTDLSIYIVHRVLHWPAVYKRLHKPHHKWVIPTPFASHAFHPLDGYVQSLPYHMFVYMVPLHKYTYLILFVIVNLWSIFIHDSEMIVGHPLENIINGPAHHTLHHMYFVYNYGQYFTWADKVGGSYRHPVSEDDPLHAVLTLDEAKKRLAEEKETLQKEHDEEIKARNGLHRTNSTVSSSSSSNAQISSELDTDSGVEVSSGSDSEVDRATASKKSKATASGEVRRRR